MSRRRIDPTYRFHKATGKAIVTYYDHDGQRRSMLLPGSFNSQESLIEYRRTLAILKANGSPRPQLETQRAAPDATVNEVVLRYINEHAAVYYVHPDTKDPTSEQAAIKEAVRPLLRLYGDLPVVEFDSLTLEAVQMAMSTGSALTDTERQKKIAKKQPLGLARTTINRHIDRIKRIMRWGCAKKLVPPNNLVNIEAVQSLKQGRSIARETEIVKPVDLDIVAQTLPFMAPCPADMVRLLLLCGCRVGELCNLSGRLLDRSGPLWIYKPERHKTLHRGHVRNIVFGPKAMLILRKYLKSDPEAFLFSPAEQDRIIKQQKRAARKTRVQPSQKDRSKKNPKHKPGECYTPQVVNRAIRRGCEKAGVQLWHTHMLRHSAALNILRELGPEAARSALGHKTLNMTLYYSGIDLEQAKAVASKIG